MNLHVTATALHKPYWQNVFTAIQPHKFAVDTVLPSIGKKSGFVPVKKGAHTHTHTHTEYTLNEHLAYSVSVYKTIVDTCMMIGKYS